MSQSSQELSLEQAAPPTERWLVVLSGASFVVLLGFVFFFANLLSSPGYPAPFKPLRVIESFFSENRAQVRGQSFVLILAGAALLTFAASLVGLLRRVLGERGGLLWVAFGAGVLASGFAMLSGILVWTFLDPRSRTCPRWCVGFMT